MALSSTTQKILNSLGKKQPSAGFFDLPSYGYKVKEAWNANDILSQVDQAEEYNQNALSDAQIAQAIKGDPGPQGPPGPTGPVGPAGTPITVKDTESFSDTEVTEITFDKSTGFNLSQTEPGKVKVSLGSSFKTIKVDGQDDVVAVGEDTLTLEAGENVNITTNAVSKKIRISAILSGVGDGSKLVVPNLVNGSESQLAFGTPVYLDSDGTIKRVDVSNVRAALSTVGVVCDSVINPLSPGSACYDGLLENIGTSFNPGDAIFVNKSGQLTNIEPEVGVGGFSSGDSVVKIGIVKRNTLYSNRRDLLVRVQFIHKLL